MLNCPSQNPNDKGLKAQMESKTASLVARLPGGHPRFQKTLQNMKSGDCWKQLSILATADMDYAKIRNAAVSPNIQQHKPFSYTLPHPLDYIDRCNRYSA